MEFSFLRIFLTCATRAKRTGGKVHVFQIMLIIAFLASIESKEQAAKGMVRSFSHVTKVAHYGYLPSSLPPTTRQSESDLDTYRRTRQLHHGGANKDQSSQVDQKKRGSSNYKYLYRVNDEKTGNFKAVKEYKRDDITRGHYSYLQPGGTWLSVDYMAHPKTGYNAIVTNKWTAGGKPRVGRGSATIHTARQASGARLRGETGLNGVSGRP